MGRMSFCSRMAEITISRCIKLLVPSKRYFRFHVAVAGLAAILVSFSIRGDFEAYGVIGGPALSSSSEGDYSARSSAAATKAFYADDEALPGINGHAGDVAYQQLLSSARS